MGALRAASAAHLKRAVIASEDAGFAEHSGVEWDAHRAGLGDATSAPRRAPSRPRTAPRAQRGRPRAARQGGRRLDHHPAAGEEPVPVGRAHAAAQGQEFVLTLMLEALLSKQRILEIYLNNVEWGEGVFGAQAAARHYFRVDAAQLGAAAGGAAGGDAAGAQALREAPRLGLRQRPRRHHRGAHGRGRIALSTAPPPGVARLLESVDERALADEIAAAAARLVVEEGMEYGAGQAQGGAQLGRAAARRGRAAEQRRGRRRGAQPTSSCSAPTPSRPSCARCARWR